jgi:hypothetical protein
VGKLVYGNSDLKIVIDDRVLAHLQIVIVAKLRRNESFLLNWTNEPAVGDGRSSVWLHQAIPLYFVFDSTENPQINRQWLEMLTVAASSAGGLRLVEEPSAP